MKKFIVFIFLFLPIFNSVEAQNITCSSDEFNNYLTEKNQTVISNHDYQKVIYDYIINTN
jgi:predicted RND superfamily exporter protein